MRSTIHHLAHVGQRAGVGLCIGQGRVAQGHVIWPHVHEVACIRAWSSVPGDEGDVFHAGGGTITVDAGAAHGEQEDCGPSDGAGAGMQLPNAAIMLLNLLVILLCCFAIFVLSCATECLGASLYIYIYIYIYIWPYDYKVIVYLNYVLY